MTKSLNRLLRCARNDDMRLLGVCKDIVSKAVIARNKMTKQSVSWILEYFPPSGFEKTTKTALFKDDLVTLSTTR